MSGLEAHLQGGLTTVARCWAITRSDGVTYGFTDHDVRLEFEGITFKVDSGLTGRALVSGTGMSVDNSEAMGALSDAAITESDIQAGRFDLAQVRVWLVNWTDPAQRMLRFAGALGEVRRSGGAFHAELRGLTEALNQPQGQVYQRPCSAVLGDARCGFDLTAEGYFAERPAEKITEARVFEFDEMNDFLPQWFERGRLRVLSGAAQGLIGVIKRDRFTKTGARQFEIWEGLRATVREGDMLRFEAGCDKRFESCRLKFSNAANFRGFPDIPGEDWLMSSPLTAADTNGGSMRG